ncbi:MAG: heparan N-sulfatase, partial [Armatimonadetes bacterium]|nr:heparan N-sulfatase [Armatimonadota bacterium]
ACFEDTVTLPGLLNDAGYRTARVGKMHYAPEPLFPFQEGHPRGRFGRDDVQMSEACRDFVQGERPFFLYWCSMNPHRGGGTLPSHPYRPDRFGNPEQPFPNDREQLFGDEDVRVPPWLPDIPEARAELAQYYQSVARLDRGIGRLMSVLREAGKYENTVILYVSDNGAAFPGGKTTLYEPGMNLPLIVRSPLHEARGTTCDGLATWADLTPTILDFAGAYLEPDAFHGRSFRPIIDRESPSDWREEIFASHTFHEITNYYPMRVVRGKRWKFTWNIAHPLTYSYASDLWAAATWQGTLRRGLSTYGRRSVEGYLHRPRFELYDLEADPHELHNLADAPEQAARVEQLCRKLQAFQRETGDPWLHKWEYE